MTDTRIKYTGATPGADSNDYVLFSTAGLPGGLLAMAGQPRYSLSLEHSHAGTIKAYKSLDGVTWVQVDQATATPSATAATEYTLLAGPYVHFKVVWTNGGSAQTTWVVDQAASKWPRIAVPPTLTWTTPASDGLSYDWGETTTLAVSVAGGTGTVTGITWKLGSGATEALVDGGVGSWTKAHTWALAEVGADATLTATATTSDGLTVTATRTVTIVDQVVEQGGGWYDMAQSATIVDVSTPSIGSWDLYRMTRSGAGPWVFSEAAESGTHFAMAAVTGAAPGPITCAIVVKKSGTGRDWCWVGTADNAWYHFNLATGEFGASFGGTHLYHESVSLGGGEYLIAVTTSRPTTFNCAIGSASADGTYSYAGDGRECFTVRDATVSELALLDAGLQSRSTQRRPSQVSPRSGGLDPLAQSTPAVQPFYWDGQGWALSEGVYSSSGTAYLDLAGSIPQPYSVLFMCDIESVGAYNTLSDSASGSQCLIYTNAGGWAMYNGTLAQESSYRHYIRTKRTIVGAIANGAASRLVVNKLVSPALNPGTNGLTGLRVGAAVAGAYGIVGRIQHAMVFPGVALTTAQMLSLQRGIFDAQGLSVNLVADGNSIDAGYGGVIPSEAHIGAARRSWLCANVAVPAQQTPTMVANYSANVRPLLHPGARNVLVFSEVLNHVVTGGATGAQALAAVWQYVDAAVADGWEVCVLTPTKASSVTGAAETARAYAAAGIVAEAGAHGCVVADAAAHAAFQNTGDTTYYQADGVHHTDAGGLVRANLALAAIG